MDTGVVPMDEALRMPYSGELVAEHHRHGAERHLGMADAAAGFGQAEFFAHTESTLVEIDLLGGVGRAQVGKHFFDLHGSPLGVVEKENGIFPTRCRPV